MRREQEAEELKRRFNVSGEGIAKSLSADFVCSFFINAHTGRYIEYSASDLYKSLNADAAGEDFFSLIENGLIKRVYPEDRDTVFAAFNKENILRVLEVDKSFSLTFRVILNKDPIYVELKIVPMMGDPDHLVCGIRNVDAHMRRIEEYEAFKKVHLTFAGIAEALASDYVCLVYVDTRNDHYQEYSATPRFQSLGIPPQGDKFFFGPEGLGRFVYQADRPLFEAAASKENILNVLKIDASFALTVRLVVEGEPVYCRIKATKMMLDSVYHVVIGISNIDEQIKREQNYAKSIHEVREIAYRDPLTGVKSKHAFAESEGLINSQISQGIKEPFALAVADVNGLKRVNDEQGHEAGDDFIRGCCMLLCGIYKHSPVYRYGGDEFVIILEGTDYEKRAELLEEINAVVDLNHPHGHASVSIGMADYEKGKDKYLHDVFQRADIAMYARKKQLKAERKD